MKGKKYMIRFTNDDEAEIWAESIYGEYISSLSEEHKMAIMGYTKSESINPELRNDCLCEYNSKTIKYIDEAIANAPTLNEDIILYRGVDMNFFTDNKCKIGLLNEDKSINKISYFFSKKLLNNRYIVDKGFLSTSLTFDTCMNSHIRLELRIPKGTKMLFINSLSVSKQLEILLGRGHTIHTLNNRLEYVSFRYIKGYYYILQSAEILINSE